SLTLSAEHGIKTETPPMTLTVIVDQPPAFVKVGGTTDKMRVVNAYDTVPLDISLIDDFGIDSVILEYRINDGKVKTEPIALDGAGTPIANARYGLKLSGKVKEGDTLQYRLKATDNRNVPERKLTPHVVYHPSDNRWFALKIARTAEPLQQQEVAAQ